jgi:hypothetical protein
VVFQVRSESSMYCSAFRVMKSSSEFGRQLLRGVVAGLGFSSGC